MKITVMLSLVLIASSSIAQPPAKDRYDGYQFSPVYTNSDEKKYQANIQLNDYLQEWRGVHRILSAVTWNDKQVFAYYGDIKKGEYKVWKAAKKEHKVQGLGYFEGSWQAIALFNNEGYIGDIQRSTRRTNLFPQGHYSGNYYGCIEFEALFTASLIEGKGDALFSVTGTGSRFYNSPKDRLTLTIDYPSLKNPIQEDLLLTNVSTTGDPKVTHDENTNKKRIYNYYGSNIKEVPKGHILTDNDLRGRKKFAKMYVSDFDQDGLLEILFWHRQYYSTLMSDTERVGFIFEKEWYSYYIEDSGTDGFKAQEIDAASAKALLATQQLTWSQGYPDNHLCPKKNFSFNKLLTGVIDDTLK